MLNKEEILQKLFILQRFGIKPGLERTLNLSKALGNPHQSFKTIHIVGTNGKGSVSSIIASILKESELKIGLYTSPHIKDFNERIRINGTEISDEKIVEYSLQLLEYQKQFNNTFFELTTVLAFKYFADEKVDIAVIEAGMGGKSDSTNIIIPELQVITKIDKDHSQYLGNTIEDIAKEKSEIMKKNIPCVISSENKHLQNIFLKIAKENNTNYKFDDDDIKFNNTNYFENFSTQINIESNIMNVNNFNFNLAGKHQVDNLKLAISSLMQLPDFNISKTAIINGLKNLKSNTGYNSRLDNINKLFTEHSNPVILDVAHNQNALNATINTLKIHRPDIKKWNVIFGAMKDKDISGMLEVLHSLTDELIITVPTISRSETLENLQSLAKQIGFRKIKNIPNIDNIPYYIQSHNKPTLICGSFYLVGDFLSALEKMLKYKIII